MRAYALLCGDTYISVKRETLFPSGCRQTISKRRAKIIEYFQKARARYSSVAVSYHKPLKILNRYFLRAFSRFLSYHFSTKCVRIPLSNSNYLPYFISSHQLLTISLQLYRASWYIAKIMQKRMHWIYKNIENMQSMVFIATFREWNKSPSSTFYSLHATCCNDEKITKTKE